MASASLILRGFALPQLGSVAAASTVRTRIALMFVGRVGHQIVDASRMDWALATASNRQQQVVLCGVEKCLFAAHRLLWATFDLVFYNLQRRVELVACFIDKVLDASSTATLLSNAHMSWPPRCIGWEMDRCRTAPKTGKITKCVAVARMPRAIPRLVHGRGTARSQSIAQCREVPSSTDRSTARRKAGRG